MSRSKSHLMHARSVSFDPAPAVWRRIQVRDVAWIGALALVFCLAGGCASESDSDATSDTAQSDAAQSGAESDGASSAQGAETGTSSDEAEEGSGENASKTQSDVAEMEPPRPAGLYVNQDYLFGHNYAFEKARFVTESDVGDVLVHETAYVADHGKQVAIERKVTRDGELIEHQTGIWNTGEVVHVDHLTRSYSKPEHFPGFFLSSPIPVPDGAVQAGTETHLDIVCDVYEAGNVRILRHDSVTMSYSEDGESLGGVTSFEHDAEIPESAFTVPETYTESTL